MKGKIKRTVADDLFSKYIRLRADCTCEWCGAKKLMPYLDCSHFHSRRKWSTRHDPDNACCVCKMRCHNFLEEHPNIHSEFFEKRLGSKKYEELNIRAQMVMKKTKEEEARRKVDLKEKINLLEG